MKEVEVYKAVKRGEPTMQKKPIPNISESLAKPRKRGVIHTLARVAQDDNCPQPSEKKVSSSSGFHASFSKFLVASGPYYHKLYDKQPSKNVLHANLI